MAALLSVMRTKARRPIKWSKIAANTRAISAEHGRADRSRRLEEPIDRQGGPERHAQPRHAAPQPSSQTYWRMRRRSCAQHRLHGGAKRRSIV